MEEDYFMQFLNKKVKVVFDDGSKVSMREGLFLSKDSRFIFLECSESKDAIPIDRIVRVEFLDIVGDKK